MCLFELSHFIYEKNIYEQGFILIPHLVSIGVSSVVLEDIKDTSLLFVIAVLHLLSAGVLALGGIYHSIIGPDKLEETSIGRAFYLNFQDTFSISSILGIHLGFIGIAASFFYLKIIFFGIYDPYISGGGDIRYVKSYSLNYSPLLPLKYLLRAPFGGEGWIISINNLEDLISGHYWVAYLCLIGSYWHIQSRPYELVVRSFIFSPEAILSYSLAALSVMGFTCAVFSWYNLTTYPSEFFGPTGPEASQAQSFVFFVRDTKLGNSSYKSQGITSLPKYFMRSPSGEIIFGGETMRFWSVKAPWVDPFRSSFGLDIKKLRYDIESWQERRSSEFMTHAPLGSLNSVGGVATELNSINYISIRSWLTSVHWFLAFFILVGHWWHAGRAKVVIIFIERGISRKFEPILLLKSVD